MSERPGMEATICPRCVSEAFALRFRRQTNLADDDPTCLSAPGSGREGPRSKLERLEELHELADRSRSSMLSPPPPGADLGEVSMSVRAAIRGVDLFPASTAAAPPVQAGSDAAREREPISSRPRPITFDRVLLAVAVGGSLVMGYKVGEERAARAGRSSLTAPELAGKVMRGATERAHRIATSFRLEPAAPRVEEPVKALPEAKPALAAIPAPSWQSHVPGANRNAASVAKAPAPASKAEQVAPAAEAEEEPTPSVPPPTMSLVEAMAAAVKAKP
ncbi:hypothetical protein [Polyangium mundeleinium]|uniref:Uncharacterized protein n=1 Tax=Polyangium mundeleinium TaxID=2995306 RepID=A0ABT5F419_9BACT|nr:hypothetical protein [Polyangium mundeleinium]MDC0748838.1 hypothetical protein [Polyangium mundeleinium]